MYRLLTVGMIAWFALTQIGLLAFAKPEQLLPPTDIDTILAGLAHTEASLKSGIARVRFYEHSLPYDFHRPPTERPFDEHESLLAFGGQHTYVKFLGQGKSELMCDGRVQLNISAYTITCDFQGYRNPRPASDPRNWGIWYDRQTLSDYLRQRKRTRIVGSENIDGLPCYVIETTFPRNKEATVKFWVTPEQGFRLIQSLFHTDTAEYKRKCEWQSYETESGEHVWFVKRGVARFLVVGKEEYISSTIEVSDFQPNVDVSHFFRPELTPETEVWNRKTQRSVPFKEIGWRELGTATNGNGGGQ